MAPRALEVLLIVLCSTPLAAQAGRTATEPRQPAYDDRRFDEDWSVLRGAGLSGPVNVWDRVKFIPLTDGEHVWLTLAGQVREREEYFHEFQFGDSQPSQSDGFLLSRIRLSADLHASRYFRVFAEAKSSVATSRDLSGGDSASFVDGLDLQNGFADLVMPLGAAATFTLRGGRQELLFGAQRLIGPSDWSNVRRTFQGASGILQAGGWTATPFWTELVVFQPHAFGEASAANKLFGVYASRAVKGAATPEFYWLGVDNEAASFNGTSGRERRQTVGGRFSRTSAPARTDFDVEAAGQFGTVGANDIRAWMLTLNGGYTFDSRLEPRLFVTGDFASGDRDAGGQVGTFNQLYPTNHTYLGDTDYVGRQNILSPSVGVNLRPASSFNVTAIQYAFWRASVHDALYNSAGSVLRPGTGTAERYIGAETDLVATYQFDRHVLGYASYNHFFPGAFITKTGPARRSDYVYGALQFTF
jgi:alginate export protein